MPKPSKPNPDSLAVGDHIKVNMHQGRMVTAEIKVVINHTTGLKFQVSFGKDLTAQIDAWQVVEKI
jgi:hypothetical protein